MARLIGDIGGTNARFALVDADGLPSDIRILHVADHPGLVEAAQAYLGGRVVDEAVIAVATPVEGDAIRFTNAPWSFSVRAAQGRLGLARLAVINDFVAQALAVPHLLPEEREQIGPGEPLPDRPIGVIGAGTGLGVSALVGPSGAKVALPTEGGHASLAPARRASWRCSVGCSPASATSRRSAPSRAPASSAWRRPWPRSTA